MSYLTLHPEPSCHAFHQLFGDRQSQPCAAILPRCGAIRLREGCEDHGLLISGNANASVSDRPVQVYSSRRCHFSDRGRSLPASDSLDLNNHFPVIGKLDLVAHEVRKDLPQAPGLSYQRIGHVWRHGRPQCEALLMGPEGQGLQRAVEMIA